MWVEIAGGSGFLVLLGIIVKMQGTSIAKKQDKAMCEQRYGEVKDDLTKGDEKFDKIDKQLGTLNKEQVEQGKVLIKVYTIVDRIEKSNNSR